MMHHQPCLGVPIKQYKGARPYHPIIVRESSRLRVQNARAFTRIT